MRMFENDHNFDHVALRDLGLNFLGQGSENIAVAGFQRNAVWKENKVEALWDSILSGFPIGAILLAPFDESRELGFRRAQPDKSSLSPETIMTGGTVNYIVVDGQQRMNAIILGFMPFDQEDAVTRLWIDLAEPANKVQCLYEFYLCTSENPFGVSGTNPLLVDEKRKALETIDQPWADDSELSLRDTYPYKAKLPVPFFEFCQILNSFSQEERASVKWESLCDRISVEILDAGLVSEKISALLKQRLGSMKPRLDLFQVITRLGQTVLSENFGADTYQVPVILIHEADNLRLGKLFERVNISGEVPPASELFYSALKLRRPLINNYVASIYNDSDMRRLLKPTELILAVLHLVDPSITELQLAQFDKQYQRNQAELLRLLRKTEDGEKSLFHRYLSLAYHAMLYQGSGDFGLPRRLLLRLRGRVWHSVMYWIMKNFETIEEKGKIDDESRLEMVRYAMMDYFHYFLSPQYRRDPKRYTNLKHFITIPFQVIDRGNTSVFPGYEIINRIKAFAASDGWTIHIPTPQEYYAHIRPDTSPETPGDFQILNEDGILYYAQRELLTKYPNIRYDIDHIVPSSWMNFRGPTPTHHFWRVSSVSGDGYIRDRVMNTYGNKRFWPNALNRSYRDKPPRVKFINSNFDQLTDDPHTRLGMTTIGDVLRVSFIDEELSDLWVQVEIKGDYRYWSNERYHTFKLAVDERRQRMYKHLYESIHWDAWIELKKSQ